MSNLTAVCGFRHMNGLNISGETVPKRMDLYNIIGDVEGGIYGSLQHQRCNCVPTRVSLQHQP